MTVVHTRKLIDASNQAGGMKNFSQISERVAAKP